MKTKLAMVKVNIQNRKHPMTAAVICLESEETTQLWARVCNSFGILHTICANP